MPKMKSHRGAAKRFKRNGVGKFKRAKANKQHILTKKSTKRKRKMRGMELVSPEDAKRLERMIPG